VWNVRERLQSRTLSGEIVKSRLWDPTGRDTAICARCDSCQPYSPAVMVRRSCSKQQPYLSVKNVGRGGCEYASLHRDVKCLNASSRVYCLYFTRPRCTVRWSCFKHLQAYLFDSRSRTLDGEVASMLAYTPWCKSNAWMLVHQYWLRQHPRHDVTHLRWHDHVPNTCKLTCSAACQERWVKT